MAIRSGYRKGSAYYGGRYNPSYIYGRQQRQDPEVISMYNPEVEAQFSQALRSRQKRFDKATLAASQALSNIGGMDTYDAPELQKRLSSMRERLNTLVQDKYNGDYGAASNEIVNMIGAERTHPFYRFNKQKLRAVKTFKEDQRRHGANFMSTKDPTNISFEDWQEGEDFGYTPINKQDIVKASANIFKAKANDLMSDPDFESIEGGKFLQRRLQFGFRNPQEAYDFLESDMGKKMVESIKSSMPELAKLDETEVMDAIGQGALAGIGRSKFETRADPDYIPLSAREEDKTTETGPGVFKLKGNISFDEGEEGYENYLGSIRNSIVKDVFKNANLVREISDYNSLEKELRKAERRTRGFLVSGKGITGNDYKTVPISSTHPDKRYAPSHKGMRGGLSEKDKALAEADYQVLLNKEEEINKRMNKILEGEKNVTMDEKGNLNIGKYAIPSFEIDRLATTDSGGITAINKIDKQLNEVLGDKSFTEKFKGAEGKNDIDNAMSITEDFRVTDIAFDPFSKKHKVLLGVSGKNSNDNRVEAKITTTNDYIIDQIVGLMARAGVGNIDFPKLMRRLNYFE